LRRENAKLRRANEILKAASWMASRWRWSWPLAGWAR
jgi:hypothetical protein